MPCGNCGGAGHKIKSKESIEPCKEHGDVKTGESFLNRVVIR